MPEAPAACAAARARGAGRSRPGAGPGQPLISEETKALIIRMADENCWRARKIQAEQMLHIKKQMAGLIAEHTGQTPEQIELDSDRDRWFTAAEAQEYGFVDHVYEHSSATGADTPGDGADEASSDSASS